MREGMHLWSSSRSYQNKPSGFRMEMSVSDRTVDSVPDRTVMRDRGRLHVFMQTEDHLIYPSPLPHWGPPSFCPFPHSPQK